MPVSYLPLIVPLLLIGAPLVCLLASKRVALSAAIISVLILSLIIGIPKIQGARLHAAAKKGDAQKQFEYAKWLENHGERIGRVILWPFGADVDKGYEWVERAAENGHPEAMYALGVRLKYGMFVPRPPDWSGPAGNVFEQPGRGQIWIDRAIGAGYQPTVQEDWYYWQVFRK